MIDELWANGVRLETATYLTVWFLDKDSVPREEIVQNSFPQDIAKIMHDGLTRKLTGPIPYQGVEYWPHEYIPPHRILTITWHNLTKINKEEVGV